MIDLLIADGVSKSFLFAGKPKLILERVDLGIPERSFVSIIGASGCGKSTLLELMAGITKPDKGKIIYQGDEITGNTGYLGYMPQDDLLFPWLSLVENALLPVRVKKGDIKAARQRVMELMPVFGLQDHAMHLPYQLSGGLRQRAAFLRTCMTGAQVMLLDEPFAGLDAITRFQMQSWLKKITKDLDLTILLVTHDIDEAICLSDCIHLMSSNPGKFIAAYDLNTMNKDDPMQTTSLKNTILCSLGDAIPE